MIKPHLKLNSQGYMTITNTRQIYGPVLKWIIDYNRGVAEKRGLKCQN